MPMSSAGNFLLLPGHKDFGRPGYVSPRGLALKIKPQRLFPSHKFLGIFSGLNVNAIRGVCGGDYVNKGSL